MTQYTIPTITVITEPQGKSISMPRVKSVLDLMKKLQIRMGTALIIRDGELLTQDREILPDDIITIRTVVSSG